MSLTPVSRDVLRGLKAQRDEVNRIKRVNERISIIYQGAIKAAEMTTDTKFQHPYQTHRICTGRVLEEGSIDTEMKRLELNNRDMVEILSGLQALFPDCTVEHTKLARGQDGKMYDVSKLDIKALPFINRQQTQEFIVIDWS